MSLVPAVDPEELRDPRKPGFSPRNGTGGESDSSCIRVMDEQQTQPAKSPANAGGEGADSNNNKPSFWKRPPIIIAGSAGLVVLLFLGLHYVAESFTHESTDDAFLDANTVSIAPQVAGRVKTVYVKDNQTVKAGDLLVAIDPKDFEVQLSQKKAALTAAEANVGLLEASVSLLRTQVGTAEATVKQSEAEAEADQATAEKAEADLKRAADLMQKTTISPQEFDSAKAAAAAANATLKAGLAKAASDRSKVGESRAELEAGLRAWQRSQAQARQSETDVQQSDLNLSYARVTALQDGRVTRKAVEEGDYVQVGQRLMALVPGEIWVIANFKETQLINIRPGQPVEIGVDSIGGRPFAGRVDSIQAGSGAAFSLLPPENAVGNYVKVVQRVPVKILFDKPVEAVHVLGPGMSVVPSVRVRGFEVSDVVVAIVAVMLALVAGFFWWRAATREEPAG
jgi:membrane fusion protein (multidrug efflux system)